MNSRGEQLEKHEIVKAKLSEQFIGDNTSMESSVVSGKHVVICAFTFSKNV